eukprot:TRINITY_DN3985_c0_g1_i1.p2 TRINITY_DN3985_c0_g1~~TRINITY_DN3985_c0_g1_i1.p2  ORF type:complete len:344 (-),score=50.29 TRINITY_DN3985_c0_g1_i1:1152-2183(-)
MTMERSTIDFNTRRLQLQQQKQGVTEGAEKKKGRAEAEEASQRNILTERDLNSRDLPLLSEHPIVCFRLDQFERGKRLGSGKFGKVYLMREKQTKYLVAMKVLEKNQLIKHSLEKQFAREVEIMSAMRHPNILGLYGWFHDNERIYLVLEFARHGELYEILKKQKRFDEPTSALYVAQLASALIYCHKKNVIHRDLKPENVLVDNEGQLKLADFGWAVHSKKRRQTTCGTLDYLAPEMVSKQDYSTGIDIWMLGVMMWEFLYGNPPFEKEREPDTQEAIKACQLLFPKNPTVSEQAKDLLRKILVRDGSERLPLKEVLCHPFITERVAPQTLVQLKNLVEMEQ